MRMISQYPAQTCLPKSDKFIVRSGDLHPLLNDNPASGDRLFLPFQEDFAQSTPLLISFFYCLPGMFSSELFCALVHDLIQHHIR